MVDKKKVCLMTELARLEDGAGAVDLKIVWHKRNSYIVLGLLQTFFLNSFGYCFFCFVILWKCWNDNQGLLIVMLLIGYIVMLIVYMIATYRKRFWCYEAARKNVKRYYEGLERLSCIYYGEKPRKKQGAGGKRS